MPAGNRPPRSSGSLGNLVRTLLPLPGSSKRNTVELGGPDRANPCSRGRRALYSKLREWKVVQHPFKVQNVPRNLGWTACQLRSEARAPLEARPMVARRPSGSRPLGAVHAHMLAKSEHVKGVVRKRRSVR